MDKFTQLSIAPILGEAISRIHDNESVSSLFGFEKEYKSYQNKLLRLREF